MTSDRGSSGGAELTDLNQPVTPKSPGLNPNANVFLSKSPTSPDSTTSSPQWDNAGSDIGDGEPAGVVNPSLEESTQVKADCQLINGDVNAETSAIIPPTSDSPLSNSDIPDLPVYVDNQPSSPAPPNDNASTTSTEDGTGPLEGTIPADQLRQMLRHQLEYYFSRENLVHDSYLQSQMDPDQYVAITTVANFNQVQKLTNNLELIVEVLRGSPHVQVDDKGEKVRPNHSRCVVILREIPDTTPLEDVQNLFKGENCPQFVSCEFAHNNSWYVTFDSDEDAQRAYQFLRNEVRNFLGKPIMARIKAKPLIRSSSYVPRNGMTKLQPFEQQGSFTVQPQQQQQQPQYPIVQQRVPYLNGAPQIFPYFQPTPQVMTTWAPSATPAFLDPGTIFQMNGYQATSIKPNTTSSRPMYQTTVRHRNTKPHRAMNQERSNSENRSMPERHQMNTAPRMSPRGLDNSQMSNLNRNRGEHNGNHTHMSSIQPHGIDANANITMNSGRPMDSQTQKKSYRRARRTDDGAKISRLGSSYSGRDGREPQFDFESNSFPPLPGSFNNATSNETFESKHSDVVKGTARPQVRDVKTQTAVPVSQAPVSSPAPVVTRPPSPPVITANDSPEPTAVAVTTASATVVTAKPVHQKLHANKTTSSTSAPDSKPSSDTPAAKRVEVVCTSQSKPAVTSVHEEKGPPVPPGVKLSYAQMVQRKKDPDGFLDKMKADDASPDPVATSPTSQQANFVKSGSTLREQTQTVKAASASARPAVKENIRKDSDPKDVRHPPRGPRSKENRERQKIRRDRIERDVKVAAK